MTFVPVSPIAAVLLNNGSCLVAAGNAMRTLAFTPSPLPAVDADSQPGLNEVTALSDTANRVTTTAGLSAKALASRLGTTHQTVTARRRRGDLGDWSRSLDPEGLSWSHVSGDGTYVARSA